jgi:3-dehydroquinate synthase
MKKPALDSAIQTVQVELGDRSYPIRMGTGLSLADTLRPLAATSALLVTDSQVDSLHAPPVVRAMESAGIRVIQGVVPAGESSKNLAQAGVLLSRAAAARLDRQAVVVALGGGMVGDLAGLVSALYLRGVRLVQIPTTLLAMVDSSVGGKTAVNLPEGKNLVGIFHQPSAVHIDPAFLATLPPREYVSGLAEIVKYGVISDARLIDQMERALSAIRAGDPAEITRLVRRSCEIKAEVVRSDERETGPRAILNFGHTLAHALENVGGYGRYLHGEAVSIGMVFALEVSVRARGLKRDEADRVIRLLKALNLPIRPADPIEPAAWGRLREAMAGDKKNRDRRLRLVLADRLETVSYGCEVDESLLEEAWNVCCQ